MTRKQASDFDQGLLDLFDRYVHGLIDRREFLEGAGSFAVGGVSATALLESLSPKYAERQQVRSDDAQVIGEYVEYSSPRGAARCADTWRDRRGRTATFRVSSWSMRIAASTCTSRTSHVVQRLLDSWHSRPTRLHRSAATPATMTTVVRFRASGSRGDAGGFHRGRRLPEVPRGMQRSGRVVGFCYGGGICNMMAVRIPDLGASVPFYGSQPAVEDVPRINAPLLIHYAGLDERINADGRPMRPR